MLNQNEQMLNHLQQHGRITTLGAAKLANPILAPAKIISNLRKLGVKIGDYYSTNKNTKRSFIVYTLED